MQETKKKAATKGKSKPRISNSVQLDANNPIPFDAGGQTFSFVNQSAYLPYLPPKDNFAQQLLECRLLSTTNNACITTKKDYCAGVGFQDNNGQDLSKVIIDWLASMNLKNQPVTKINQNIFEDFFTWGNVPIEIVKFTSGKQRKLFVYVQSFLEWRLGAPNDDDCIDYAIQSKLFLRGKSQYISADQIRKAKKLPIYNPLKNDKDNWFKDPNGVHRTLLWYKNSVSGFPYYGVPSNVASMIYQLLEYKAGRFNLDNFENNMVVAALLALKGNLSQEEANKIGRNIIKQYTGDGKRGRTIVVASEEGITGSDFHKMDTKTDGSYTEIDNQWAQKIILANQWDSVLAGLISPSTLGKGAGFLTKILEIKLNTVIRPAQRDLVDNIWKTIFKIADEWIGTDFSKYDLEIRNAIDISGLTDVDITPAVQVNEVREAKGLKPDDKMRGVYMKAPAKRSEKNEGGDDVQD